MYLIYLVTVLGFLVAVIVGVAFTILLERRILSYIQVRKGPNKVGYIGVIQSFGDAIKLFVREQRYPVFSNLGLYYFSPIFTLLLIITLW